MAHPPLPGHHLLRRLPPSPEKLPTTTTTTSIFPYSSPFNNHQQTTYDLHSKIMLTAIISLSVVVFVVTALHIYARVLLRRQSRARAALRSFRLAADVHSLDPPTSSLDPAVIASLPIFVYKTTAGAAMDGGEDGGEEAAGDECAVCLSVLEDEEMARSLPNCKHVFHAECIDKWLSSHSNCPICRTEAEPRVQPVVREGPAASAEGSSSQKGGGSGSGSRRLSSIRRMLSRERSSRRIQAEIIEDCLQDLERQ